MKKFFFYLILILIPVFILSAGVFVVVKIAKQNKESNLSDYEKELARMGTSGNDLRARAPYVMFRPNPYNSNGKRNGMNTLGFNSPEISVDKKPNEYRIAIIGGSVAFNGGPNENIVAFLAKELKENVLSLKGKDVTYINGGIPSAVTGQELAQFIYYILPLNIDMLVVFDGFNDFYIPFNFDRRPGYPFDYIVEEYRYYKFKTKDTISENLKYIYNSLIPKNADSVMADYYKELGIKVPSVEENIQPTYDIYFRNISYITKIANAFGIKTAVFLQPYSPRHNKPGDGPNVDALLKLYSMADGKFKELEKENCPERIYYNMTYMGFRMEDKFTDLAHFGVEANHQVAKEMLMVMKKYGMFK